MEDLLFFDEIIERLTHLGHGDGIIIVGGGTITNIKCLRSVRYENGIISTQRRFIAEGRVPVDNVVMRIYEASKAQHNLYLVIDGVQVPF